MLDLIAIPPFFAVPVITFVVVFVCGMAGGAEVLYGKSKVLGAWGGFTYLCDDLILNGIYYM